MATDSSLLQLEELLGKPEAAPAGAAACCISSGSSSKSGSNGGASSVRTEGAARAAAIEAAAHAASLSERCRSLLPLLKQAAESRTSSNGSEEQEVSGKSTVPSPASDSNSSSSSRSKGDSNKLQDTASGSRKVPQRAELLELDSDAEGPVVELEVGVGVLDVKGQVPNDARLAEMGVQVVDLPDDSPVFLSAATTMPPLDALQRVLAVRQQSNSNGQRPVVSVLSSGSSSGSEEDSDDDPNEQP